MIRIGSTLFAGIVLLAATLGSTAYAEVTATVDRNAMSLGDSLRLTITATDDEDLGDKALAPLQQDFEILQRSSSSNTSIINGHLSQSRQLVVELAPRRQGTVQIPALHVDDKTTSPITVTVGPASDIHSDGEPVVFEAEVDRKTVYVQGQVILTLRVQQSVNLEGRGISQLKLDNAFVKPLEQHSFQRTIDGRQWLVDEVRYAIFPEHSGTLEIPAQVFSGRIDQGRRSFFDLGNRGPQVRRSTQPLSIEVLPKPDSFGNSDWLPARKLTLQENWSTDPDKLRVGESATRTVRIVGEGLQGAQLPPILFTPTEGLKYYPDQPRISEQETGDGLEGTREDSAAVVPTRAGRYVIPEIRIPWWDTQKGQVQYAVLPEHSITVAAAEPGHTPEPAPAPGLAGNAGAAIPVIPVTPDQQLPVESRLWQVASVVSTLGWLVTGFFLWRSRRPATAVGARGEENIAEKQALRRLLAACASGNASGARTAMVAWTAALVPGKTVVSLDQVAAVFADQELTRELDALNASLYRPDSGSWSGGALGDCVRRLRRLHNGKNTGATEPLQLYPDTLVATR